MKDQNQELSMRDLKKFVEEDEERIVELCKCIEGYDDITGFTLDAAVYSSDGVESFVDILYMTDNLGNINMLVIKPPMSLEHFQKYHFSKCEYVFGYKTENRNGYYIEVAFLGGKEE